MKDSIITGHSSRNITKTQTIHTASSTFRRQNHKVIQVLWSYPLMITSTKLCGHAFIIFSHCDIFVALWLLMLRTHLQYCGISHWLLQRITRRSIHQDNQTTSARAKRSHTCHFRRRDTQATRWRPYLFETTWPSLVTNRESDQVQGRCHLF